MAAPTVTLTRAELARLEARARRYARAGAHLSRDFAFDKIRVPRVSRDWSGQLEVLAIVVVFRDRALAGNRHLRVVEFDRKPGARRWCFARSVEANFRCPFSGRLVGRAGRAARVVR